MLSINEKIEFGFTHRLGQANCCSRIDFDLQRPVRECHGAGGLGVELVVLGCLGLSGRGACKPVTFLVYILSRASVKIPC